MRKYSSIGLTLAVILVLTFGMRAAAFAADSHTGGHSSGGSSGGSHTSSSGGHTSETTHSDGHDADSGKRGPKYQGGGRGTEHSSQVHKGSSHHDSGSAGSKAVESRIFSSEIGGRGRGPMYTEGGTAGTDSHDSGAEHTR